MLTRSRVPSTSNANARQGNRLFSLAPLAVLAMSCLAGGCSLQYPDQTDFAGKSIAFPGSRDYVNRIASFKLTIDDAYHSAETAAKTRSGTIVQHDPMFIVDRFYAFGVRESTVLPLTGVYINGDTGSWKFVDSDSVIALIPAPHIAKK